MEFSEFLRSGRIRKEETSKAKIAEFLQFAEKEISAARFNLQKFPSVAYKSAYDALIHGGNALMRFYGFRPTTKYTHVTITEFVEKALGKESVDLARVFKHMRRKRHPLQYEACFTESSEEVRRSVAKAQELIHKIEEHIGINPAQHKLF